LEIDPDFELANKNIRVTLRRLGRDDSKFNRINELFREVEKDVQEKNWRDALVKCKELAVLNPGSFRTHIYLANIYFTIRQFDNAKEEYLKSLEIQPHNLAANTNLALLYFEMRKYDLSKGKFEYVLKLDPNNEIAKQQLDAIDRIQKQ
jgi:tetratricopeptide (TPR) repeat protein